MATLFITELASVDTQSGAPVMPPNAEQSVAIGGSSTASKPFSPGTRFALLFADTACSLAFAAGGADDPVAAATAHRMAANEKRIYAVPAGGKVATIA